MTWTESLALFINCVAKSLNGLPAALSTCAKGSRYREAKEATEGGEMKLTIEVDVPIDNPEALAKTFCDMPSDKQAEFFVQCARQAEAWDNPQALQWFEVGKALETKFGALAMLRNICEAAE